MVFVTDSSDSVTVSIPNKKVTATDPLLPVFTADILGGRYVHFGLDLEPTNLVAVSCSRNMLGPFIENRFKASPHSGLLLSANILSVVRAEVEISRGVQMR